MRRLLLIVIFLFPTFAFAQNDRLQIVTSIDIIEDVVQNVAGNRAVVSAFIPLYADPHDFQPLPQEVVTLADVDAVFVSGAGLEQGLIEIIQNAAPNTNIVTASECVEILPFGEHSDEDHAEEEHADEAHTMNERCAAHHAELDTLHDNQSTEHTHEHAETLGVLSALECGHEASEAEHDHGACDPHVWADPHNVMLWTLQIRDTLSELDPANAETYATNAADYIQSLEALLHDELLPLVEALPAERRVLLTNHETLNYFAAAFGFEVVGTVIPGGSTLAEPSAGEIAAIIDTIRAANVPAVFAENTVGPNLAEQIAAETGAQVVTLYSDSLSVPDGPATTYLDYMRYNVRTIVEALS